MADLRFENKNNQKKTDSIFASGVISTSATMDEILFTLPEASIVTRAYAVVLTASGVADSTIDIKVGTTLVNDEAKVDAVGVITGTELGYFPTGGIVTVVAGSTAPDDAGRIKVIVEYIETELTNGTYTD